MFLPQFKKERKKERERVGGWEGRKGGRKKGRRKERRKGGQKTEEKRKKIKQNKEKDERNSMGDKFQLGALESWAFSVSGTVQSQSFLTKGTWDSGHALWGISSLAPLASRFQIMKDFTILKRIVCEFS